MVAGGALLLAGTYLYDIFHGIWTIETRRDRVRYEYGKRLAGPRR
ncbi:MAG: hypothetical protein AAB820_01400 [Patescibacteria group bacterium]